MRLEETILKMVAMSKHHFVPEWTNMSCKAVVHPWTTSCLKASPMFYKDGLLGSAKFFSLIYLAQIIVGSKTMIDKEQWIKIGKNYLRSVITGMLIAGTGCQLICLFRNLMGKYSYYTFILIPFTMSGLCVYLEMPSRRRWITNAYINLVIEYFLRQLEASGYLYITKTKQVFMFMLGNALLMYLMRSRVNKEGNHDFWFFTPEKVRSKSDECTNVCPHEGDCMKHILKGTSTYFGISLAISLAKVIIPQIRTPVKAMMSIRARHLRLAFFLSSYVGIYKAIICYLCHIKGCDSALYAIPAGCLAGLSSAFSPNLGLAIASITAAFKLYLRTLYEKKGLPFSEHITMVMLCLCQGILFNTRVLDSDMCPKYVSDIMNSVTNGLADFLTANFYEIVKNSVGM